MESSYSEELGQSKIVLQAYPTESRRSLLALSTQGPGIFTGGVVFLCHVSLRGPVDTQGQILHWDWFKIAPVSVEVIEPVLNPTKIFRERSVFKVGEKLKIFKNYQS